MPEPAGREALEALGARLGVSAVPVGPATRKTYRPDPTSYTNRPPSDPASLTEAASSARTAGPSPASVTPRGSVAGTCTRPTAFGGTVTSISKPAGVRRQDEATRPRTLSYEADTRSRPEAGIRGANSMTAYPGAAGRIPARSS